MCSPFNYPLFVLGETGVLLHERLGSEALAQVTSLSHQVLTSLVLELRRDPIHAHALIQRDSVGLLQDLAKEGKRIIQTIAAVEQFEFVGPEMPLLESLLSELPAANASKYFRRDQKGVIYIRCRNLPRVQRKALYQELFSKNQQVRLHGDHYIACPEDWFSKILEKLYGGSTLVATMAETDWAARPERMGVGVLRPTGVLLRPTKITARRLNLTATSKPLSHSGLSLGWWTALPGQIEQIA